MAFGPRAAIRARAAFTSSVWAVAGRAGGVATGTVGFADGGVTAGTVGGAVGAGVTSVVVPLAGTAGVAPAPPFG